MKVGSLFFGIILAFVVSSVSAQDHAQIQASTIQKYVVKAGTVEHAAVIAWLKDRQQEGQFPVLSSSIPPIQLEKSGDFVIENARTQRFVGSASAGLATPAIFIPDPPIGSLPTTGSAGQTYTIASCVPRGQKVDYEYKWDPDANNGRGGWILIKVTYTPLVANCNSA